MKSITIDQKSMSAAAAGQIDLDNICDTLELPASDEHMKCVKVRDHGFILSRSFQPTDALLTISLASDGPLTSLSTQGRQEALGRIMRCATMLVNGRTRSIPVTWRSFHSKNRLSFQADRYLRTSNGGRTEVGRVILELTHAAGQRVFAFQLDRGGARDLSTFHPPVELQNEALDNLGAALSASIPTATPDSIGRAVALDAPLSMRAKGQLTSDDWYQTRLTVPQRRFVDHPHDGSIRLIGPAGTGKTVALVVKCVRDLKQASAKSEQKRFLFLTHASATAEAIENLVLEMEPDYGLELLASERPNLIISTLYSLANRQMRYDLDELTPVSLDGHEGRLFQADVLNDVIEEYKHGDWITHKSKCSEPFVAYMLAARDSMERRFFLWEMLNEFACVLDAEGIRSASARREQYLSEKRKGWMMVLQTKEEREVTLALYDRFRSTLREMKAIGGDQMVTDFLNHLDSFRWEATREVEGFDAVFVDELHLFNRQERMIFRHLLKSPAQNPTVFMAYDAKQSPRDTFLKLPSAETKQLDFWRDAKLGKVEKIELLQVFRYTPQIAQTLARIDESFPGQDLDEEWPQYRGVSKLEDGPTPTACMMSSTVATYTLVFQRARMLQRELGKEGRVAVLCASNELFKRYLDFSELRDSFVAITSRDEASSISRSTRKFLFSMPEFVAGLQFDTILLIDVNQGEVPDGPYSAAALRKFVSQVYLGASRAERRLEFYAAKDQGGIAALLSRAILDKTITVIEESSLSL